MSGNGEILTDFHDRKFGLDANGNLILRTGGALGVAAQPFSASAAIAAGSSDEALVTITVANVYGNAIAFPHNMDVYLSDSAAGAGLTATTASGAVAAGASGTDLGDYTAKKAKRVQTSAGGVYVLTITDTAKTAFKVCVDLGIGTAPAVVATLAAGNYG